MTERKSGNYRLRIGASVGLAAALSLAAAGCGSNHNSAPSTTTTQAPALSPNAARMAIANGLTCKISSVKESYHFKAQPDEVGSNAAQATTEMDFKLKWLQTAASVDARRQYATSPAVQWYPEALDLNIFTYKNGQISDPKPGTGILFGDTDIDSPSATFLFPTALIDSGHAFAIYSAQDVETGTGASLREAVTETPCGVVAKSHGNWDILSLHVQGSTMNLVPPQAEPFPTPDNPSPQTTTETPA